MPPVPDKPCVRCGRRFSWRKKWARDWEQVRFCSDRCRRARGHDDEAFERAMRELLAARAKGLTLCPSEVARAVDPSGGVSAWRTREAPRAGSSREGSSR